MGFRTCVAALGLATTAANAAPPHRLVVVVAAPGDPRALRQHAMLDADLAALRERDVVVQAVTPDAARRDRPELGVAARASFELLLIGRDGGVKLRRDTPVAAKAITALIDTMPMRQAEMRQAEMRR